MTESRVAVSDTVALQFEGWRTYSSNWRWDVGIRKRWAYATGLVGGILEAEAMTDVIRARDYFAIPQTNNKTSRHDRPS
jgi:hypothetical protein